MKYRHYRIFLDNEAIGEWIAPTMSSDEAANSFRLKLKGYLRTGIERAIENGSKLTAKDISSEEWV